MQGIFPALKVKYYEKTRCYTAIYLPCGDNNRALPLGAVLKYGLMSDNGHLIFRFENYSYFDVTPFGYAMFHYMICAVTTTITAMLSLLWIFFGKKRQTPITVLSAIALAMSAVPYIIMTFNVFTVIISALLAAVLVISVVMQIKHE